MSKYILDAISFGLIALLMTIMAIVVTIYGANGNAIALSFLTAGIAWLIYIVSVIYRLQNDEDE